MSKGISLKFKKLKLEDKAIIKYGENINCLFVSKADFPEKEFRGKHNFIASFKKDKLEKKVKLIITDHVVQGQMYGNIITAEYIHGSKDSLWGGFLNKKHFIEVKKLNLKNTEKLIELDLDIDLSLKRYQNATQFSTVDKEKTLKRIKEQDENYEEEFEYEDFSNINSEYYDSDDEYSNSDYSYKNEFLDDADAKAVKNVIKNLILNGNLVDGVLLDKNAKKNQVSKEKLIKLLRSHLQHTPLENGYKFVIPIKDNLFTNTISDNLFLTCTVNYGSLEKSKKLVIADKDTKIYPYITSLNLSSLLKIDVPKVREKKKVFKEDKKLQKKAAAVKDQPFIKYLYKNWGKYKIGGMGKEINLINEQVLSPFLLNKKQQKTIGIKPPRGVLFHGVPGTGKTHLCKAIVKQLQEGLDSKSKNINKDSIKSKAKKDISNEVKITQPKKEVKIHIIKPSDIKDKYTGEPARKIKEMFDVPKNDPNNFHVYFFDEAEGLFGKRMDNDSEGDYSGARLSAFLPYLSGSESDSLDNILIILATNMPEKLDGALTRSGRIDVKIEFSLPDIKARQKILEVHTKKISLDKDVNLAHIAKITTGFSGADIKNLISIAQRKAINCNTKNKGNLIYFAKTKNPKKVEQQFLLASVADVLGNKRPDLAKYYRIVAEPFVWYSDKLKQDYNKICNNIEYLDKTRLLTVPIFGKKGAGKTAMALNMAIKLQKKYDFNVEFIQAQMLFKIPRLSDKISFIESKFREAISKKKSIIVIDNIEDVYNGYPEIQKYMQRKISDRNNIPKDKQIVILATADEEKFTKLYDKSYDYKINLSLLDKKEEIQKVLDSRGLSVKLEYKGITKNPKTIKQWVRLAEIQARNNNKLKRTLNETQKEHIEKFGIEPKKKRYNHIYM